MLVIGLTGGIASGKTTISRHLEDLGAKIIDADEIARKVVEPGEEAWKRIKEYFGEEVIKEDNTIDRPRLGQIIFQYPEKREMLNRIIHPQVINQTKDFINAYKKSNPPLVVVDAPLLIEANMTQLVDEVWVIDVTPENQIKRAMERDNLSIEAVEKRLASQMPTVEKLKFAHRIIDANGSKKVTLRQIDEIWQEEIENGYDKIK